MAEANRYEFNYKEVAEALVKQQDLHEGLWTVTMKFGIGAAIGGPSEDQAVPTAMVPVLNIGLTRATKENNLTVDAARVNPVTKAKRKASTLLTGGK